MVRLLIRLAMLLGIAYCGYAIGKDQPNEASRLAGHEAGVLAGRMSACQQIVGAMQKTGDVNPGVACVVYNGDVTFGFPEHSDAPHFHLDGSIF